MHGYLFSLLYRRWWIGCAASPTATKETAAALLAVGVERRRSTAAPPFSPFPPGAEGPLWPIMAQAIQKKDPAQLLNPNQSAGRALEPSAVPHVRRRAPRPEGTTARAANGPSTAAPSAPLGSGDCPPSARPEAPSRAGAPRLRFSGHRPRSARPASARGPEQRSRRAAPRLRPPPAVRTGSDRASPPTPRLRCSLLRRSARRPLGLGASDRAAPRLRRAVRRSPDGPRRRAGAAPRLNPSSARPEHASLPLCLRSPIEPLSACPCPSVCRAVVPSGFAIRRAGPSAEQIRPRARHADRRASAVRRAIPKFFPSSATASL
jgi:hypothetical protein